MKEKIEYIDFAKGYAIFSIVLYHFCQRLALPPMLQKAIIFGGTGVHLFFLLSGFGLGLSKTAVQAGSFYRRRMTKVWGPYVLALTISLLAAWALGLFRNGPDAWLAGVFLYQMFSPEYIASFGGHFWFISAIMQFYLAFPLIIWAKNKIGQPWGFFGLCLLISMIWWEMVFLLGKGDSRVWNSFFLQFLWEFALGLALADAFQQKKGLVSAFSWGRGDFWNHKNAGIYLLVGLLFTGLMIVMILKMGDIGRIFNDIPALIGYTALSIFIFRVGERFLPPLKKFFLWVGSFSFSLYLVHVLVLEMYLRLLELRGLSLSPLLLLPYLGLALAAGWAFEPVSRWWTALFERLLNPAGVASVAGKAA